MTDDVVDQARDGFGRAAAGWRRWSHVSGQRDTVRYLTAAGIGSGARVLEIGAGTGDQTLALARHVGADGEVLATDLTEDMLAVGRDRARAAGLSNVTFRTADASRLQLDERGFDAAVSGFTWMFLPDPVAAAAEVRHALAPGCRFVASVWGPVPEVPMIDVAMTAASHQLGRPPAAPGGTELPDLSDRRVFTDVLVDAGFEDVSVTPFSEPMTWESADEYARWVEEVFVTLADVIAERAGDRAAEIYAGIAEAARTHAAHDGTVTFHNLALLGSGRRPV